jgi:hypothetical protein
MSREHLGIAALGITTVPYLRNPEAAFATVDWLNSMGYNLGLEIYPYHTPAWVSKVLAPSVEALSGIPIPKKIGPDEIEDWKLKYPNARVTQVHLPFAFDLRQGIDQVVKKGIDSPRGNAHHLGHLLFFGRVVDGYAQRIMRAIDDPDVIVNAHQDVLERAVATEQVDRIELGKVAIEDYKNPPKAVKEWIAPLSFRFNLGLDHTDHLNASGLKVADVLKDEGVRKHTTVIHLAGPEHAKMTSHDLVAMAILQEIAKTPFARPVRAYLDLHPENLKGMNTKEELRFWQKQLDFIKSTQPQLA